MGVGADADWIGRLYQSANRLAYPYFLREIGKVDALLANVYFTGDPHSPTTRQAWDKGISVDQGKAKKVMERTFPRHNGTH